MIRPVALVLALSLTPLAAHAQDVKFSVIQESLDLKKSDVVSAQAVLRDGSWGIEITLSLEAGRRLADITARNVKKPMQLALGDRIVSTPIIQSAIAGGTLLIMGNLDEVSAKALAARIAP